MAVGIRSDRFPAQAVSMPEKPLRLFISVGEESADLHAASLCQALKQRVPGVELFGFGGKHMAAEGVDIRYPLPELALIGFVEVIRHFPQILRVKNLALRSWREERPDAVILVDYPGFHLRLARLAHKMNLPVFYYIAPQAWAWKENRVEILRETLQHLLVIFPFEEPFFQKHGIPTTFVGHPLVPRIPAPARTGETASLLQKPVIGLLPGSRRSELRHMLPPMLAAAHRVREQLPHARFLLPLAHTLPDLVLDGFSLPSWIEVCRDPLYARRREMTFAWTSSGTATVENALLEIPMAVVYRTGRINMWIGRKLVRVSYIGMVNLIAQKGICPEFIQEQCEPERLARYTVEILGSPERYEEMRADLEAVRKKLGTRSASETACDTLLRALGRA